MAKCLKCQQEIKTINTLNKRRHLKYVMLTPDEYGKLIDKFGVPGTTERIKALNDYLGSKGKRYKSHYYTILVWDRKHEGEKPKPALQFNQAVKFKQFNTSSVEAQENRRISKERFGDKYKGW